MTDLDPTGKAPAGDVARRWQSLAESDNSVYRRNDVPPARVEAMARSGYVAPVVAATREGDRVLEADRQRAQRFAAAAGRREG